MWSFLVSLIGLALLFERISCQQYVIKRDFRTSYQFNSFSVFTFDERQIIYRVETQYSLAYAATIKYVLPLSDFIIVAHIDAALGSDQIFRFRILNNRLGYWIDGQVIQRNRFLYSIELSNYQQIIMESVSIPNVGGSIQQRVRFVDGFFPNRVYAEYVQRTPWSFVYDLRIFVDEHPIELYLTGLSIAQRRE